MTADVVVTPFTFDNTYALALEGGYVPWRPAPAPQPRAVMLNHALAAELGLPAGWLGSDEALQVLSGNAVPDGAHPLAQAYAGHQFGMFSPVLGDGRALLLGEVVDTSGRRRDIAFKGSGRTPFSRGGDGKAALGPVLREYLMGEAMHALGVPTTRALAAVATGERVVRDRTLPGAVLTRVAASHLRVGTFEFACRRDPDLLRRLAAHAIERHDPDLAEIPDDAERHLALLARVVDRQAALVARWMGLGFIHGVMNTDNMSISGETIDYGPCAFLEAYDPATAFSSIDETGRYAYGNQPRIASWNLTRFAETLGPLVGGPDGTDRESVVARLVAVLDTFPQRYAQHWTAVLRAKLGLADDGEDDPAVDRAAVDRATVDRATVDRATADRTLGAEYLDLLHQHRIDVTLGWRRLADAADGDEAPLLALFGAGASHPAPPALTDWLSRWRARSPHAEAMRRANPIYIPRNHLVERALAAGVEDDLGPFESLLAVLASPFEERPDAAAYAEPAPAEVTAGYRTFCGT